MNIPKGFKGTIYFYWNVQFEWVKATDSADYADSNYVLIGQTEVEADLNGSNVIPDVIAALEGEIESEREKSANKIATIKDRISSMLALEHVEASNG